MYQRTRELINACIELEKSIGGRIMVLTTTAMHDMLYQEYGREKLRVHNLFCLSVDEYENFMNEDVIDINAKVFEGIVALNIDRNHPALAFASNRLNFDRSTSGMYFKRILYLFG